MELTWYGLSCFRITERNYATVVVDPFNTKTGLGTLKLKADVVTISHDADGHNYADGVSGYSHALNGPGEYEIGSVFITGIATGAQADNVVYLFDYHGISIAHLGNLKTVPTQTQIEAFGEVNVLLLPVGGGTSLTATQASEVVSMIEPGIVVPMHYATDGLKAELDSVDRFLQEMGAPDDLEESNSLKLSGSPSADETAIVLLAPKSV